jgi:hypothetical protein
MALRGSLDRLRRELDAVRNELTALTFAGDANLYVASNPLAQLRPDELPPEATAAQRRVVAEVCAMDATIPQCPDVPAVCDYGPFSTEN